ncbi:hypothetical protein Tco_0227109 [Tanacetum coccineum]
MADSAWIEVMQEELHQFDRLDVRELVDRPLCKNGYSQQEGIDFEESFAPVARVKVLRLFIVPSEQRLMEVKRIFRYLKNTINMGLWYLKDTSFKLTAFSDLDHADCLDTRCGIQFLGDLDHAGCLDIRCGIQFLRGDKHQLVVKETKLHFNVFSRSKLADLFTKALSEDRFKYLLALKYGDISGITLAHV